MDHCSQLLTFFLTTADYPNPAPPATHKKQETLSMAADNPEPLGESTLFALRKAMVISLYEAVQGPPIQPMNFNT